MRLEPNYLTGAYTETAIFTMPDTETSQKELRQLIVI